MLDGKKLKRVVVKEEFVAITGSFVRAVILNQFIYWAERVKDFDEFKRQENERALKHGEQAQELSAGWIYKTAEDLSNETMLGLAKGNMRNHIKALIEMGFLQERNNPKYKWDRTKQYRVSLYAIEVELREKGYHLDGYTFAEHRSYDTEDANYESGLPSNESIPPSNESLLHRKRIVTAIPETTTETTTEITLETTNRDKRKSIDYLAIVNAYKETCVSLPTIRSLSEARKKAIRARLNSGYTQEDFITLFRKAQESDFLKGKNDRNWNADFDWLIKDANMAKVLEGKYDNKKHNAPPVQESKGDDVMGWMDKFTL